jgi:hypothetical protein
MIYFVSFGLPECFFNDRSDPSYVMVMTRVYSACVALVLGLREPGGPACCLPEPYFWVS